MAEDEKMMKKVKAMKRRGVESLFQKIGVSDGTVDLEYEDMKKRHDRTVRELHEMVQSMSSYLERQRNFFSAGADLADVTYDFYFGRLMGDWPAGTPSALRSHQAAAAFKAAWAQCNDAVRRSVAKTWLDQSLGPLRAHVAAIVPEAAREHEIRQAFVKDFDSYRRRYHALQDRHAKAAAADPASAKAAELERGLYAIQSKLTAAEDRYRRQNAKAKELMLSAKLARDELLETAVLTMLTLQMELFRQTADRLGDLAQFLPQDRVQPLKDAVRGLVAKGGPEVRTQELSGVERMFKTMTSALGSSADTPRQPAPAAAATDGGAAQAYEGQQAMVPSQASTGALPLPPTPVSGAYTGASGSGPAPAKSPTKPSSTGSKSLFSSFFPRSSSKDEGQGATGGAAGSNAASAEAEEGVAGYERLGSEGGGGPAAATAAAAAEGGPPVYARALFDNEPEDETELGFAVGDVLQILLQDESGWWEARLNGKIGSIPANYVEIIPAALK